MSVRKVSSALSASSFSHLNKVPSSSSSKNHTLSTPSELLTGKQMNAPDFLYTNGIPAVIPQLFQNGHESPPQGALDLFMDEGSNSQILKEIAQEIETTPTSFQPQSFLDDHEIEVLRQIEKGPEIVSITSTAASTSTSDTTPPNGHSNGSAPPSPIWNLSNLGPSVLQEKDEDEASATTAVEVELPTLPPIAATTTTVTVTRKPDMEKSKKQKKEKKGKKEKKEKKAKRDKKEKKEKKKKQKEEVAAKKKKSEGAAAAAAEKKEEKEERKKMVEEEAAAKKEQEDGERKKKEEEEEAKKKTKGEEETEDETAARSVKNYFMDDTAEVSGDDEEEDDSMESEEDPSKDEYNTKDGFVVSDAATDDTDMEGGRLELGQRNKANHREKRQELEDQLDFELEQAVINREFRRPQSGPTHEVVINDSIRRAMLAFLDPMAYIKERDLFKTVGVKAKEYVTKCNLAGTGISIPPQILCKILAMIVELVASVTLYSKLGSDEKACRKLINDLLNKVKDKYPDTKWIELFEARNKTSPLEDWRVDSKDHIDKFFKGIDEEKKTPPPPFYDLVKSFTCCIGWNMAKVKIQAEEKESVYCALTGKQLKPEDEIGLIIFQMDSKREENRETKQGTKNITTITSSAYCISGDEATGQLFRSLYTILPIFQYDSYVSTQYIQQWQRERRYTLTEPEVNQFRDFIIDRENAIVDIMVEYIILRIQLKKLLVVS